MTFVISTAKYLKNLAQSLRKSESKYQCKNNESKQC